MKGEAERDLARRRVCQHGGMARFALSALGVDRPGIVAALSGALASKGLNLADSTMTVLQGHFAVLLVIEAPDGTSAAELEAALEVPAGELDLVLSVRPLAELPERGTQVGSSLGNDPEEREPWVLSVHGADRPGIVHAITSVLAGEGANIVDLSTHLVGDDLAPLYTMHMALSVPRGSSRLLAARVIEVGASLGVHCQMNPGDSDLL